MIRTLLKLFPLYMKICMFSIVQMITNGVDSTFNLGSFVLVVCQFLLSSTFCCENILDPSQKRGLPLSQ